MQWMSAAEIRQRFLDFFAGHGHTVVPSSPLVPQNDPTLLFTNAGMVQFKAVFTGQETLPFKRAVSAQKCVRAGGKHNDLENVGKTARHHTFFEMLGNFSFGDYFKEDAIRYAWQFLTAELKLPKEKLWATIYQDDDEAYDLWLRLSEIPAERIVRLGEADNFWSMGDTGPCGPCSEIIIDRGEEFSCGRDDCALDTCGCDRWLELWNLVFMQYQRHADGRMEPLPKPSIDTGMGLERIASVMQGVSSNFDTDLLKPIIDDVASLAGKPYQDGEAGFPFRVIADHIRAGVFLIADGVFPSNEFRGYVLRRILRRAVRFGRLLGFDEPFLYRFVPSVVRIMGGAYPDIVEQSERIEAMIREEEARFLRTLDQGMALLDEIVARCRAEGRTTIPGADAFMLYDTYGFPIDLTLDVADEENLTVDIAGFEAELERQRERARAARGDDHAGAADPALAEALAGVPPTRFLGYERLEATGEVLALLLDNRPVDAIGEDAAERAVGVVLDQTPFYAEAGGQVGDSGVLIVTENNGMVAAAERNGRPVDAATIVRIETAKPLPGGRTLHLGRLERGTLRVGQRVHAQVDAGRRMAIMRHHTATHLLHQALKDVLGGHANQAGSLVAPDRLRFDFTHFERVTPEQLVAIEDRINEKIWQALPVQAFETSYEDAVAAGAMALFGEKYGDRVRVVRIGDYSMELCGGTHVDNSAHVGLVKLTSESSVAAGIRRIEAVAGEQALAYLRRTEQRLQEIAEQLRTVPEQAPAKVQELLEQQRELERALERQKRQAAQSLADELWAKRRELAGATVIIEALPGVDPDGLRQLADALRGPLGRGVAILAGHGDGRVHLLALVGKDLVAQGVHAGKLIGQVAKAVGGGGGGRPDLAQAGGKAPEKLPQALALAEQLVTEALQAIQ